MVKEVNPDGLSGEERFEMKAAFGADAVENGDVVRLEESDLKPVQKKRWPMADLLEVDDYIEYETLSGRVICGEVTEVGDYYCEFDRDTEECGVGVGYVAFDSFGGDRGVRLELLRVNGEPRDVSYTPYPVEE